MKTRRVRLDYQIHSEGFMACTWSGDFIHAFYMACTWSGDFIYAFYTMNENETIQNRYCCVHLCNQRGSAGPNGKKVKFFSFPAEKSLREQWLHAIWRDTGEHFLITNSTKVCSLHFKDEHLKKSFGKGQLSYIDGAVPSVSAWKRCSVQKRPLPRPIASIVKPPSGFSQKFEVEGE